MGRVVPGTIKSVDWLSTHHKFRLSALILSRWNLIRIPKRDPDRDPDPGRTIQHKSLRIPTRNKSTDKEKWSAEKLFKITVVMKFSAIYWYAFGSENSRKDLTKFKNFANYNQAVRYPVLYKYTMYTSTNLDWGHWESSLAAGA